MTVWTLQTHMSRYTYVDNSVSPSLIQSSRAVLVYIRNSSQEAHRPVTSPTLTCHGVWTPHWIDQVRAKAVKIVAGALAGTVAAQSAYRHSSAVCQVQDKQRLFARLAGYRVLIGGHAACGAASVGPNHRRGLFTAVSCQTSISYLHL